MADLIDRDYAALAIEVYLCSQCDYDTDRDPECIACPHLDGNEILESVPAVNRWIQCSERLPLGGRVLATTKQGYVVDVIFIAKGSQWFRDGEYFTTDTVIAWMPMPDAYKPPEKE